jgi:tetratricopeptide (TPR) repeat protein
MKKYIIYLLLVFSVSSSFAQNFEPSKEEIEKYSYVFSELSPTEPPSPKAIRKLDSLYQLDSNSLFLKGMLCEMNMRLIYDSSKFELIPQTISITNSLLKLNPDPDYKKDIYFSLASLYNRLGEFETTISFYTKALDMEQDTFSRMMILGNIASSYMNLGNHKKALEFIKQIRPTSEININNSLFAEIYFNNNLLDSALFYANQAINGGQTNYKIYSTKAKILKAQDKTDDVCALVQQAMALIEKQKLEEILSKQDKTNPFIQLLIKDVEEAKQLQKEHCH